MLFSGWLATLGAYSKRIFLPEEIDEFPVAPEAFLGVD